MHNLREKLNTLKIMLKAWDKVLILKANFYNPKCYKHLFITTLTFHNDSFDTRKLSLKFLE